MLLVSITGFTVYKHYCGDELTGVAFFADSSECHKTSCNQCEDVMVSCKLHMEMLSTDTQNIPENIHFEITPSELLFFRILVMPETVGPKLNSEKTINDLSLPGISILQSFRC